MEEDRSLVRERRRAVLKVCELVDLRQRRFEVHELLVVLQDGFVTARGCRKKIVGLRF